MKATVHVGPKGGTQYRIWTGEYTFRVVGKYVAWPHMSAEERSKAVSLEDAARQKKTAQVESDMTWRNIMRGG